MPKTRPDLRKYDEPMTRKHVPMPDYLIKHAKEVGDGNFAAGVRKCVERDLASDDDTSSS